MARNLARPNAFREKHKAAFPSDASLRWILFSRRQELEKAGAVIKMGRAVLIDEDKFFAVLEGQTGRAA